MSSWGLTGSSPFTLAVAAVGAFSFFARAPTLGSMSYVTYVRPFLHSAHGGSIPEGDASSVHTAIVVAMFWTFDKIVGRVLARLGSQLPSSIAAMIFSFGAMVGAQVCFGTEFADRLSSFFRPGVRFLGRYMMSFLTVVVVPIPSAVGELWGQGGALTLAKVLLVHWAGWCFTHFSTAGMARVLGGSSIPKDAAVVPAPVQRERIAVPRLSTSLDDYRKSDNFQARETFAQPTSDEMEMGRRLVSRRVSVDGYGPGTVIGFNKTYLQGASTHDIEFDADGQKVTLKLARKSNTDPEKKQWLIAPILARRVQTGTAEDQLRPIAPQARTGMFAARREKETQFAIEQHRGATRNAWTTATCIAYAALPWVGPAPALVCTLQASLLHAEQLRLGPAAPLIISAATTSFACICLGKFRGDTMATALAKYVTKRGPFSGPGDFHYELIGSATLALAFRMFEMRKIVFSRAFAILGSVAFASTTSLFITPIVAKAVGLAPALSLMLSQRCVIDLTDSHKQASNPQSALQMKDDKSAVMWSGAASARLSHRCPPLQCLITNLIAPWTAASAIVPARRSVTTPFALAGATALGASTVLTASVLSIGALHCALFGMRLLKPVAPVSTPPEKNALARGLAFGCSSYGTG